MCKCCQEFVLPAVGIPKLLDEPLTLFFNQSAGGYICDSTVETDKPLAVRIEACAPTGEDPMYRPVRVNYTVLLGVGGRVVGTHRCLYRRTISLEVVGVNRRERLLIANGFRRT